MHKGRTIYPRAVTSCTPKSAKWETQINVRTTIASTVYQKSAEAANLPAHKQFLICKKQSLASQKLRPGGAEHLAA
jgi:hypothetical protein